jgi:hypothetical protein
MRNIDELLEYIKSEAKKYIVIDDIKFYGTEVYNVCGRSEYIICGAVNENLHGNKNQRITYNVVNGNMEFTIWMVSTK